MTRREKLALTVVTGSLGSGKTTLLRRALSASPREQFAAVVNEAADTGVDAELLAGLCARAVDLAGGCACCERRAELIAALKSLYDEHERGELPDLRHVVVETSGLADPLPIVAAVAGDPVLRHHYEVRSVVAVVDGLEAASATDFAEERPQLASADRILVSKSDLVSAREVNALRARLAATGIVAPVELTAVAWRDLFRRLTAEQRIAHLAVAAPQPHQHADGVSSTSITFDGAVDWVAFGVWLSLLLHAHGGRVLRVKGIVPTDGLGTIAINSVRRLLYPPEHVAGVLDGHGARLVVIAQELDATAIRRSLDAFQRIA